MKEKIKKILFPFSYKNEDLDKKWWHRFFIVIFSIFVVSFFLFCLLIINYMIPETMFNIDIKYTLREFTKTRSKDLSDTVPSFLLLPYKFGCFKNNKVEYVSIYALEKTICSPDLRGNINKVAEIFSQKGLSIEEPTGHYIPISQRKSLTEQTIAGLTQLLDQDTETRYCFVHKDVDCSSDKIIAYQRNFIFYSEIFLLSLLFTYLLVLILQFIYFKGLIYIIYGNKKYDK